MGVWSWIARRWRAMLSMLDVKCHGLISGSSLIRGSSLFSLSFSSSVTSRESARSGFYFGGDQPFFVDSGVW